MSYRLPDIIAAFERSEPVRIRNPGAVRPWQHVLDCLEGYLDLTDALLAGDQLAGHQGEQVAGLAVRVHPAGEVADRKSVV